MFADAGKSCYVKTAADDPLIIRSQGQRVIESSKVTDTNDDIILNTCSQK